MRWRRAATALAVVATTAGLAAAIANPAADRPGTPRAARLLAASSAGERVRPVRANVGTFLPTDPLVPQQWYLSRVRAYDAWAELPTLAPVRVAVIDSGVDLGHPDLAGRVAAARSFVGGPPTDMSGHGTVVAGVIAAQTGNGIGIAGLAPSAQLLVAKVVERDGTIPLDAEVQAIHWAVAHGARVINMSLGGVRDPSNPGNDTYSPLEANAIAFAVSRGAVVVAAVGNGDQAPAEPWRFAFYPAALPHVLGVSAVGREGAVPGYSNRDAVFNDVAAPGADIVSTFPRRLTQERPACQEQGYTLCATVDFRPPDGTSFAAPQASAAAATLLAVRPELRPEQVTAVLERAAVDASAATGCIRCATGRDAYTGWGTLDITASVGALGASLPAADALETNDDSGAQSHRLSGSWRRRHVEATIDYWDDQDDVYAVYLRRGQRLDTSLEGTTGDLSLALWRPGTPSVQGLAGPRQRLRLSARPGPREHLGFRAETTGWHYVQVRIVAAGETTYRLSIVRSS